MTECTGLSQQSQERHTVIMSIEQMRKLRPRTGKCTARGSPARRGQKPELESRQPHARACTQCPDSLVASGGGGTTEPWSPSFVTCLPQGCHEGWWHWSPVNEGMNEWTEVMHLPKPKPPHTAVTIQGLRPSSCFSWSLQDGSPGPSSH